MKIEKQIFENYLKKVSLNKTVENCLLTFGEDGVSAESIDRCMVSMVVAKLSKEKFVQYEPIGEVVIKNVDLVMKMVKVFPGVINIKIKKNRIIFNNELNTKALTTTLASKEGIDKVPPLENIKFTTTPFKIDTEILRKTTTDIKSVFGDATKACGDLVLMSEGDGNFHLIVEDSNENKIRTSQKILTDKFKVKLSNEAFNDVVNCLTEEKVEMNIQTDLAIKIEEVGEFNATYVIAPIVVNDENEEVKEEEKVKEVPGE